MTVRADVIELLHAGYGDRTIARQVGVSIGSVTRARAELGLPRARGGIKPAASVEDLFWRRTRPVEGGHLEWDGHRNGKGTPTIHWLRDNHSALRVAFRIRHGQEPVGYAFVACEHPGCVAPDHIGDSAISMRPAHHRSATGMKPNGSRDDIAGLLREGLSDKQIGKRLRTNPKRVAAIRKELGLPAVESRTVSFEERWTANTEPVDGGHIRWTGRLRDGSTPALLHDGRDASVRRIAFAKHHGRAPHGRVLPGCGLGACVRPEHLEDQMIRDANERADLAFEAIFGRAS